MRPRDTFHAGKVPDAGMGVVREDWPTYIDTYALAQTSGRGKTVRRQDRCRCRHPRSWHRPRNRRSHAVLRHGREPLVASMTSGGAMTSHASVTKNQHRRRCERELHNAPAQCCCTHSRPGRSTGESTELTLWAASSEPTRRRHRIASRRIASHRIVETP